MRYSSTGRTRSLIGYFVLPHGQVPACGAVSGDVDVSLGTYSLSSGGYLKWTDHLLDDLIDAQFKMEKEAGNRHKTYLMPRSCICVDDVQVTRGTPCSIRGGRRQLTELKRVECDLKAAHKLWSEERELCLARAAAADEVARFHAPAGPRPSAADAAVAEHATASPCQGN